MKEKILLPPISTIQTQDLNTCKNGNNLKSTDLFFKKMKQFFLKINSLNQILKM